MRPPRPALWLWAMLAGLSCQSATPFAPAALPLCRPPPPVPVSPAALRLWPDAASAASILVATIDADIEAIPDDEFGKVFAGAGVIVLGSLLSLVFVAYLIESNGKYADLVAETYAEQDFARDDPEAERRANKAYADALGWDDAQRREAEEMVRAFNEKKARKAGTWTAEDEERKQQMIKEEEGRRAAEEEGRDMFSDYD